MKAADRIVGVNKEIQKHPYEKLEHSTQNNGIGQWACVLGLSIREVSVMFMAFLKSEIQVALEPGFRPCYSRFARRIRSDSRCISRHASHRLRPGDAGR